MWNWLKKVINLLSGNPECYTG